MKQMMRQWGIYAAVRYGKNKLGLSLQDSLVGFFGVKGLSHYKED